MSSNSIVNQKVIHTDLMAIFEPFYKYFKILGVITYTITVNKSSRNLATTVSITKWDLFKFILITMIIITLTGFNSFCNLYFSEHVKLPLLILGIRTAVAGSLVFALFIMISEVVNRHEIAVLIEQLNEIDDGVYI